MLSSERVRRWLKFSLALTVSVIFSALFLLSIDLEQVGEALLDANYVLVPPALGLFALSLVARSLRWRYMYLPQRSLSWRQLLPSLLVGYAGNNLLPLRVGELLRAQHLADRAGTPRMLTIGTLMMERLFDGAVLATFLLWGLLLVDSGGAYLGAAFVLAGGAGAGFVIGAVLARDPGLTSRLMSRNIPFLPDRWRREIGFLGDSFFRGLSVLTNARLFVAVALTTAAAWGLEISMYWVVSRAFDLDASFITIAFAGAAANVAMSIPSAQGGVGPFQVLSTEALLKFGVAKSAAAAYSVALHIFLVGPVSLVGLLVLWRATLPSERARLMTARIEAAE